MSDVDEFFCWLKWVSDSNQPLIKIDNDERLQYQPAGFSKATQQYEVCHPDIERLKVERDDLNN